MVAHCNTTASKFLKNICSDFLGSDAIQSCSIEFGSFIERTRKEKNTEAMMVLDNKNCLVMGRLVMLNQSQAVVLVILEKD